MRRIGVRLIEEMWYGAPVSWGAVLLAPFSVAYALVARARRALFGKGVFASERVGAPVIVAGNLTVGGTGKTPLVIWLAHRLRAYGYRPGVVCRGYGGKNREWPRPVGEDDDPILVGDEAVLLVRRAGCPVVAAGPERVAAARHLVEHDACDIVISDDGLQHYRLARDIEINVVDGTRRYGNGWCLPGGPLREPVARLASVDFIVVKGEGSDEREYGMELAGGTLRRVTNDAIEIEPVELPSHAVHAVAGVGNPVPFFERLQSFGLDVAAHTFPDHHAFTREDIDFGDGRPVIMTEKDAVKCRAFADERHWYLPIEARLNPRFEPALLARLPAPTRTTGGQ